MNQRQRKKQIKQKIERNEALSIMDYKFIEKNCPELAQFFVSHNIDILKEAAYNIGVAMAQAIKELARLIREIGVNIKQNVQQEVKEEKQIWKK